MVPGLVWRDCADESSASPSPSPESGGSQRANHVACHSLTRRNSRCAASTLAHSKTSPGNSWRQMSPRVPSSLIGESSALPFFQALNSLMKENPDQDSEEAGGSAGVTSSDDASRSADLASRLAFTRARW